MQPWYKSATKIVLVIITAALIVLTYKGIIEQKDFMMATMLILGYYFTKSGVKTGQYKPSPDDYEPPVDDFAASTPTIDDIDIKG